MLFVCFCSYRVSGQEHHVNLIIQINDKLIVDGLQEIYIKTDSIESERIYVKYVPGDLILTDSVYNLLNSEDTESFKLYFGYATHDKRKSEYTYFSVGLSKQIFSLPYLILNVYDFRDKRYRKWYQSYTKEDFLVERISPNSGVYIRNR